MRIIPVGAGVNITIQQGETVQLPMTVSIDMTGYIVKAGIGKPQIFAASSPGVNLSAPVYNAGTGLSAFTLTIASALTAAFPVTPNYLWDVWMVSPAGVETPLFSGLWAVTPSAATVP